KEGWHDWNKEEAREQSFYAEYENYGPGASPETRVSWSHQLTAEEAALYTKENILWNNADFQK
ncbi:MAG: pectin methylesterase, partial [Lachnospiraceae bacterium]|nr:pectin methylesterase [Lachnospiraceae bacterium]